MGAEIVTITLCWNVSTGNVPNGPTYDQLAQIFRDSAQGQAWGSFSAPRVVRTRGGDCTWNVQATALLSWPSNDPAQRSPVVSAAMAALYDKMEHRRRDDTSFAWGGYSFTMSNGPWQANINGPLDWWTSGQAANSRTRSNWDSLASTDDNENPVGPNDLAPQQRSGLGSVADLFDRAANSIKANFTPIIIGAAVVGVAGTALYFSPEIKAYMRLRSGGNDGPPPRGYPPVGYRPATVDYVSSHSEMGYRRR